MSLRDRFGKAAGADQQKRQLMFKRFGVVRNPYPPAGEPTGHPHMETAIEEPIVGAIESFERDHVSQVLLIEGTQGVGKTNLLNYFQRELQDLHRESEGYYIIRYYPDPESTFDGILRRIFQEFDTAKLLTKLGEYLKDLPDHESQAAIAIAASHDMQTVLRSLRKSAAAGGDELGKSSHAALEWLTGLRVLKKHRELLGVNFRLDTVESKTQALRDLVFCCSNARLLSGLYLLLDELEKQDYSFSKTIVLRYLSAIRALIDALPNHLFLIVALTIDARQRYFAMLPAFAGRLQNIVRLNPLKSVEQAVQLSDFYVNDARAKASQEFERTGNRFQTVNPVAKGEIQDLFSKLLRRAAAERAQEGVTHRDFLNALYLLAEEAFARL